ncbi:hypothetical protein BDA96_04G050400 [Sorghum bicolor]|uniref:Uncharacterized protein n=2 Tax=Sorghum bicolor TaxID=4558 RepID=A0A1Z5RKX7_SORBI|nr:hypothetical protein BDA96_04G050400 [Sorghum bicolor]OQU84394.1 hypothetical protein SORBI_3004G045566 [Sorghum bicolor]
MHDLNISVKFSTRMITIDSKPFKLQIWDMEVLLLPFIPFFSVLFVVSFRQGTDLIKLRFWNHIGSAVLQHAATLCKIAADILRPASNLVYQHDQLNIKFEVCVFFHLHTDFFYDTNHHPSLVQLNLMHV